MGFGPGMRFLSTNRTSPPVDFRTALIRGQAPDKGLYMPEGIPRIPEGEIRALAGKAYADVAFSVTARFLCDSVPDEDLRRITAEVYTFEVPVEPVHGGRHILRLDRGPTASFKDFAAQLMGRLMDYFLVLEDRRAVILTATSGDTGGAIAHAFHGKERIEAVVLFPADEVSDRQRRQMTTLGENVLAVAVDGKFDDCQSLVKSAFADPYVADIPLSSANSINFGRLLPQAVYYFYAYAQLASPEETIVFSVPSGNFGNLMGGLIAKRMGLPVELFVVATNENDEFPRFLESGVYERVVPSRRCLSTAMNVGHPSNLARLVSLYGGQMDEVGRILERPDIEAMGRDMVSRSVSDDETRRTIREAYDRYGLLLEPHGAVGWRALEDVAPGEGTVAVSIETAHPAKFPDEIRSILGIEPPVPPSLAGIDDRREIYEQLPANYPSFRRFLEERYR